MPGYVDELLYSCFKCRDGVNTGLFRGRDKYSDSEKDWIVDVSSSIRSLIASGVPRLSVPQFDRSVVEERKVFVIV